MANEAKRIVLDAGAQDVQVNTTGRIFGPDGTEWGPKLAAVTAALKAADQPITTCSDAELQTFIRTLNLKPGDVSGAELPDSTVLAGVMQDGDALITTPQFLPRRANWDDAMETHPLMVKQGVNNHGRTDWRLPNMEFEKDHANDESWMLYRAQDAGKLKGTFDKSGSFPASTFWSARRCSSYSAYCQWVDDGTQNYTSRGYELPVRPVRRLPPSPQGAGG